VPATAVEVVVAAATAAAVGGDVGKEAFSSSCCLAAAAKLYNEAEVDAATATDTLLVLCRLTVFSNAGYCWSRLLLLQL